MFTKEIKGRKEEKGRKGIEGGETEINSYNYIGE